MLVLNLATSEEHHYTKDVSPLDAVKTSYAMEKGLLTGVVSVEELTTSNFPIFMSERTVSCGDWCTLVK